MTEMYITIAILATALFIFALLVKPDSKHKPKHEQ
jgi:hypothetical protein